MVWEAHDFFQAVFWSCVGFDNLFKAIIRAPWYWCLTVALEPLGDLDGIALGVLAPVLIGLSPERRGTVPPGEFIHLEDIILRALAGVS